jgi:hypothetical protein
MEVIPYLKSTVTWQNISTHGSKWVQDYKVAHIDTGSSKPLKDVMVSVFCVAYVMAWPTEYAHWKHARDARLHGGH